VKQSSVTFHKNGYVFSIRTHFDLTHQLSWGISGSRRTRRQVITLPFGTFNLIKSGLCMNTLNTQKSAHHAQPTSSAK
jgi:hypothetical protein